MLLIKDLYFHISSTNNNDHYETKQIDYVPSEETGVLPLSSWMFYPIWDIIGRSSQNQRKDSFKNRWHQPKQKKVALKLVKAVHKLCLTCKKSLYGDYQHYQNNINEKEDSVNYSSSRFFMLHCFINWILLFDEFIPLLVWLMLVNQCLVLLK